MNPSSAVNEVPVSSSPADRRALFWACFTAIAATAAVFAVRGQVIGDWALEFGLTETQKGEILGVGLWPFAAAIVGVSMVADRIGYGKCLCFAFVCHVISTIMLIFAQGYWWLYAGTFLVSIGNGAAQAIADPVVASMYRHNKTTWLNILHASWPAGMVVGGIAGIALGVGGGLDWRWRIGMLLVPILLYGVLMLGHHFPVHERIAAPVVKLLTPLGVLIASCVLASVGLVALSRATGLAILAAATLYGIGKTYLWPTMLGVVAERFPKGGALSLNATSAVGMMSVRVVGTVFLGLIQDRSLANHLQAEQPAYIMDKLVVPMEE